MRILRGLQIRASNTTISKKEVRLSIKEDGGRYGRANFAGKPFDSVHLIPVIKYSYVAYLKVIMRLIFAFAYGLLVYMIYWTVAYSESCQTSKMELFCENNYLHGVNLLA